MLSHERHLNNVEITVPYHHHELVGHGSGRGSVHRHSRGGWKARKAGDQGAREVARQQARAAERRTAAA